MRHLFPTVLLSATVSSAVATLITLTLASPSGPAPVMPAPAVDVSPVLDRLGDMRRRLDELAIREGTVRQAVQEPDPVRQNGSELADLMQQTRAAHRDP